MRIHKGRSAQHDANAAVAEATTEMPDHLARGIVFAFVSMQQDTAGVVSALERRFPGALVVGCTTAGEIFDGVRSTRALVVSALETSGVRWAAALMRGLRGSPDAEGVVAALCAKLGCERTVYSPNTYFAMTLVDGMSGREEVVSAALAEALCGIALVGGSAADGLAFQSTQVFANNRGQGRWSRH
jgi:hypothetical protein